MWPVHTNVTIINIYYVVAFKQVWHISSGFWLLIITARMVWNKKCFENKVYLLGINTRTTDT